MKDFERDVLGLTADGWVLLGSCRETAEGDLGRSLLEAQGTALLGAVELASLETSHGFQFLWAVGLARVALGRGRKIDLTDARILREHLRRDGVLV